MANDPAVSATRSLAPLLWFVCVICLFASVAVQPIVPEAAGANGGLFIGGVFLVAAAVCFIAARYIRNEDAKAKEKLNG